MPSFHEFSFPEQREIRSLIAQTWETARETAPPVNSNPEYPSTITVGSLLSKFALPAAGTPDREEADRLALAVLRALSRRGVMLIGPRWLGGCEYYAWVMEKFLPREIPANTAPHRPQRLRYTDLEPFSLDAIFLSLEHFIRELAALSNPTYARVLADPVPQVRYADAWQQCHRSVTVREFRPLAIHDRTDGSGVEIDFNIICTLRRETGLPQEMAGEGKALLIRREDEWKIAELRFPGFTLPSLEQ